MMQAQKLPLGRTKVRLIGVPMDLGGGRRGVDMGPSAIRYSGIGEKLKALGYQVTDDGDVAGAISAARPNTGVDMLIGIGGTPEGIIAACALKCMGGAIHGRLWPRDDAERTAALEAGYDLDAVLTTDDLVQGDNCFFAATGVTDGELLRGVHYESKGASTQSLVMRSKSGTVRMVNAWHRLDKLQGFAMVDYA